MVGEMMIVMIIMIMMMVVVMVTVMILIIKITIITGAQSTPDSSARKCIQQF